MWLTTVIWIIRNQINAPGILTKTHKKCLYAPDLILVHLWISEKSSLKRCVFPTWALDQRQKKKNPCSSAAMKGLKQWNQLTSIVTYFLSTCSPLIFTAMSGPLLLHLCGFMIKTKLSRILIALILTDTVLVNTDSFLFNQEMKVLFHGL